MARNVTILAQDDKTPHSRLPQIQNSGWLNKRQMEQHKMRKFLLGGVAAAALALAGAADAAIVADLGINPNSATGHFNNSVGGALFADDYLFTLQGASQFITFSSATNVFAGPVDFITNFSGQVFSAGANLEVGGGDDLAVGPLVNAVACQFNPAGCQILAGTALLDAGTYFLRLTGQGGGQAGYGGNLATVGVVPLPAALPLFLTGLAGMYGVQRYRRRKVAEVPATS
jgi:hypothetical protein